MVGPVFFLSQVITGTANLWRVESPHPQKDPLPGDLGVSAAAERRGEGTVQQAHDVDVQHGVCCGRRTPIHRGEKPHQPLHTHGRPVWGAGAGGASTAGEERCRGGGAEEGGRGRLRGWKSRRVPPPTLFWGRAEHLYSHSSATASRKAKPRDIHLV